MKKFYLKRNLFVRKSVYINKVNVLKEMTSTEEIILWAVWRLGDDAYGVTIRKIVSKSIKRIFPYGTLYSVLAKLTRMEYVRKVVGDPAPIRGGRRKNYYRITKKGKEALKGALDLKKKLWDKENELALIKEISR